MRFPLFLLILFACALSIGSGALTAQAAPETPAATSRDFTRFSANLPAGWDGEERTGFRSGNDEECMLILGLKDQAEDNYRALVSIFVLPNEKGATSENLAQDLTQFQADATEPQQDGHFWSFNGEPRTQGFKSSALTKVNATKDMVLIAIIQDPENLGALEIFDSLKGLTPQIRELLGK